MRASLPSLRAGLLIGTWFLSACDAGTDVAVAAAGEVTIHADQTQQTTLLWGLLHGVTRRQMGTANPTPLIQAVQPKIWNLSNHWNDVYGYVVQDAQFPLVLGTKIGFNVHASFLMAQGGNSSTRICVGSAVCPTQDTIHFATFADLEQAWQTFLTQFLDRLAQGPQFDWYLMFAEPDNQIFGLTLPNDLVTLYLDAESAIRARYPQAKLVAPSYLTFSENGDNRLVEFVTALRQRGGTPDAIAWHEFGANPGRVVDHAAAARAVACGTSCPEFHVDEYGGPMYSQLPGPQVAWLHYFQVADIQQVNRACWDLQVQGDSTFSTCWAGFNGLLDDTYQATQPIYWVHERYARMTQGGRWLVVSPFADVANTTGVAAVAADMGSTTNEVRILVGNYGFVDLAPFDVVVTGYPYRPDGQVNVAVERIPSLGGATAGTTISRTAQLPDPSVTTPLPVQGGRLVVRISTLRAGDAYSIVVTPR